MKWVVTGAGLFLACCTFMLIRQVLVMRGHYDTGVAFGWIALLYLWMINFALFLICLTAYLLLKRRSKIGKPNITPGTRLSFRQWYIIASIATSAILFPFVVASINSRSIADQMFAEYCRSNRIPEPVAGRQMPEITFKGFETDYVYTLQFVDGAGKLVESDGYPVFIRTDVFGEGHILGAGG